MKQAFIIFNEVEFDGEWEESYETRTEKDLLHPKYFYKYFTVKGEKADMKITNRNNERASYTLKKGSVVLVQKNRVEFDRDNITH